MISLTSDRDHTGTLIVGGKSYSFSGKVKLTVPGEPSNRLATKCVCQRMHQTFAVKCDAHDINRVCRELDYLGQIDELRRLARSTPWYMPATRSAIARAIMRIRHNRADWRRLGRPV